jgi:hypothetical protein
MSQGRESRAFALWRVEGRTGEDEGRLLGDRAVEPQRFREKKGRLLGDRAVGRGARGEGDDLRQLLSEYRSTVSSKGNRDSSGGGRMWASVVAPRTVMGGRRRVSVRALTPSVMGSERVFPFMMSLKSIATCKNNALLLCSGRGKAPDR